MKNILILAATITLYFITTPTASAQNTYNISAREQNLFGHAYGLLMPSLVCDIKPPTAPFEFLYEFGNNHLQNGKPYINVTTAGMVKQARMLMRAPAAKKQICGYLSSSAGKKKLEVSLAQNIATLKAEHIKAH